MKRTRTLAASFLCTAWLVGCPQSKPAQPPPSELPGSETTGAVHIPDAGTSLTVSVLLPDGGVTPVPYEPNAETFIEPALGFEVTATSGLKNYRLRLFDESDRALVSNDEASDEPKGGATRYRAVLAEPLKAGHKYTLVLDAQSGDTASNAAGRPIPEQRIALKVLGEREKPAPPPPAPTKKRRRHR